MFDVTSGDSFSFSDSVYSEDLGCCPECDCKDENTHDKSDSYRSGEDKLFSWEDMLKIASVLTATEDRDCPTCENDEPGKTK